MNRIKRYILNEPFVLESSKTLKQLTVAYHTFGKLNKTKDNVIWVFHALTANSNVLDWWPSLTGKGKTIDPDEYFIVCANVLGSFYGTTGPRSNNPETGQPYGLDFPFFTVKDVVNAQLLLANHLGIEQIKLAIGGSFGGFQALEFALLYKGKIDQLILIATGAKETAWSIAIHESQRLALKADHSFYENSETAGQNGLRAARGIGLLTYRTYEIYKHTQTDTDHRLEGFKAASYIRYQGDKLANRFHAHCYYFLTKCLDSHNPARGHGSLTETLYSIYIPTLVIGISSDKLVPVAEQKFLATHIPNATFRQIDSKYGHDGFLIEGKKIGALIKPLL